MDLLEIQNKLNNLLEGDGRKIVFWYDDDASYEEDIDHIELANGSKLLKLTGTNNFATKLLLERQDTETNYLVYAPFARPEDKENALADIFYYSEHFYSDKLVQLMGDLNIPPECMDKVKLYKDFWKDDNIVKLQALQIEKYTDETVELGILCVLAGVKVLSFEQMLRKTVLAGVNDNKIIKKIDKLKIDKAFWQLCERHYGYKDSNPTIQKFLVTMIVTYMDIQMNGNEPKPWKMFVSSKRNDSLIFVKNLMSNDESKAFYDEFANSASGELNATNLVTQIPLDDVVSSDAFEIFDENIISWIVAKLEDQMLDERIAGMTIPEICETRSKVGYHYSSKYEIRYNMLNAVYYILKEVLVGRYQTSVKDLVEDYVNYSYLIDTYYRKFYFYLDKVGLTPQTEKIRDLVENMYTNKYLTDMAYKWNTSLTNDEYVTYSGNRQEDFFSDFVKPFMKEQGGGRVIVIISDGMRYECARELFENFELDEKCNAKMNHMLSVLPSETALGMASLLPNKQIVVDDTLDITVDSLHCGNSTAERQKILQSVVPRSACYDFDTIKNAKQADVREMLQDKDLIYIYQNQIDQRGEGMKSDNEVFNACSEAITEIQDLIRKLTGYVSNTRYLVTADHGFIYKRDKLAESDKIKVESLSVGYKNKRYLLSKEPIVSEAMVGRMMKYLSGINAVYVTTPIGADIIKMPGGGQNYVHGGSTLQEMIVPVIKVNTFKGKQDTGFVDVELSTISHRVTSIEVRLDFMQMEPVTDKVKPRRLLAFFVDSDNSMVSFPVPITANNKSTDAKDRIFQEKFTLKSGKYSKGQDYYLVIANQDDIKDELHRYKFEIDISDMAF